MSVPNYWLMGGWYPWGLIAMCKIYTLYNLCTKDTPNKLCAKYKLPCISYVRNNLAKLLFPNNTFSLKSRQNRLINYCLLKHNSGDSLASTYESFNDFFVAVPSTKGSLISLLFVLLTEYSTGLNVW